MILSRFLCLFLLLFNLLVISRAEAQIRISPADLTPAEVERMSEQEKEFLKEFNQAWKDAKMSEAKIESIVQVKQLIDWLEGKKKSDLVPEQECTTCDKKATLEKLFSHPLMVEKLDKFLTDKSFVPYVASQYDLYKFQAKQIKKSMENASEKYGQKTLTNVPVKKNQKELELGPISKEKKPDLNNNNYEDIKHD